MLIDKVRIRVAGGKGGDGIVLFSKEKMTLGPTGGNGGQGGSIFIEGKTDIGALRQFRYQREFKAESGKNGTSNCRTGVRGKDIILKVPVGVVIKKEGISDQEEITRVGEKILLAKGGKGGRGNFSFKSSKKTSPKEFTQGTSGEKWEVEIELKLIADVGLVGLPNVGKSSLLNKLTGAKSKVANYQFTTLEPHLGVFNKTILADIPGLITGASTGRGLGIKFLRHIERTKIVLYLISSETTNWHNDYKTIQTELFLYKKGLELKPSYLVITKIDLLKKTEQIALITEVRKEFPSALAVSIYNEKSINELKQFLNRIVVH